ncbi:MAG: signal recognition particle-docking protein FtsY [Deltaproteobacteria bacterium]|jgi:fused signal recognition particle receptor|nr:signal recognition particle-docking protein FtsY [Deltaproteobacteria bacterium]
MFDFFRRKSKPKPPESTVEPSASPQPASPDAPLDAPVDAEESSLGAQAQNEKEASPKGKGFFASLFGRKPKPIPEEAKTEEAKTDSENEAIDLALTLETSQEVEPAPELTLIQPQEQAAAPSTPPEPGQEEPTIPPEPPLAVPKEEEPPLAAPKEEEPPQTVPEAVPPEVAPPEVAPKEEEPQKPKGFFGRLKEKLFKTREIIADRVDQIIAKTRSIDNQVLEELEEILYTSDLGVKTTTTILAKIKNRVARKELKDSVALKISLRDTIVEMMNVKEKDLVPENPPRVILVVGVNGVGKTTTIAKLARTFSDHGQKVLLAAGDTFRAAAVDQLKIWAGRIGADFVAQPTGSDAAAVVFDAITAAKARGVDVVLIDTAGRLHTKSNLMDELKKIKRVANKALPGCPHETILILDANTGQNALRQAQTFNEAIGVDSLIVTKLDGTSKGGIVPTITHELKIPVIFIGIGEKHEDLKPFDSRAYANAIMGIDEEN